MADDLDILDTPEPETDPKNQHAQLFRAQLQSKIQKLLDEFAMGKISREQFHLLYERYSSRLAIAEQALMSGNPDAVAIAQTGPPTIAIRAETEGKAMGMIVYHTSSGRVLETLGEFTVSARFYAPIIHRIGNELENDEHVENKLEKTEESQWLLFLTREYTTVITQFQNEPARQQIRTLERLHHDFEEANRRLLTMTDVNASRLAYPLSIFVKKRLRK